MGIESFETSYDQIFEQVYPQIEGHKIVTLRTLIYLILDNHQAEELCQKYGIQENASLDKDLVDK